MPTLNFGEYKRTLSKADIIIHTEDGYFLLDRSEKHETVEISKRSVEELLLKGAIYAFSEGVEHKEAYKFTAFRKVRLKIGRYEKLIGKNDIILDNGACYNVITQRGKFVKWSHQPLIMSKKLFNDLKRFEFIYVDDKKTKEEQLRTGVSCLTYYRFNIEKLVKFGYEVVEDDGT